MSACLFLISHVGLIEEAIRKGISDADSEARAAVRRLVNLFLELDALSLLYLQL